MLTVLGTTAIISAFASSSTWNQLIDAQRADALQVSRRRAASVGDFVARLKSDVLFLSRAGGTSNYLDLIAAQDRGALSNRLISMQTIFLDYAQNITYHDQILFLDNDGHEIVHLTTSNRDPVIVAKSKLQ